MAEDRIEVAGGCLCGAVRYLVRGKLRGVVNCHCSKCRRFHGHYGAYTSVALADLTVVEGRGLKWFDSTMDETPNVRRGFCAECGASLFWHPADRRYISVAAGSLDQPSGLRTIGHVWTGQIGDYYDIRDDLPRFERGWEE